MKCPMCQSELELHQGNKGEFFGCSSYPMCEFTISADSMSDEELQEKLEKYRLAYKFLEKKHDERNCKKCNESERPDNFHNSLYHYFLDKGGLTDKQMGAIEMHLHDPDNERTEFKYPPRQQLSESEREDLMLQDLL